MDEADPRGRQVQPVSSIEDGDVNSINRGKSFS